MRYINKWIGNFEYRFLEITIYDQQDIDDLQDFTNEKNIIVSLSDLKYLKNFVHIEKLIITSGEIKEKIEDVLKTMVNLRQLKIDYEETETSTPWCIDVSILPNLQYLFSKSSRNFCNVSFSTSLKTLIVMKWYDDDLMSLENSTLDSLCIYGGNLKTLVGIENTCLNILSIANLRKLSDISCLEKLPLKILEIDNCNKIVGIDTFSSSTLEYLMIYGKNAISSGIFVMNFKNIKRIMLDIKIEDGDLSYFDILEHAVVIIDKRNYNRKNSQLPKSSFKYEVDNIPEWRYIYSNRSI